ncbi:hypothetical protein C2L65_18425 [Paraburkholderia terrae]|uniref:Uncharacterized protein n=1 Tax=Paraburkholderia terrae TaxID=311230 RepID=A0A2I8EQ00_9BURK|nr:hypothetical protein C2L65_18425 [Paraburkholderia terrae]
MLPAAAGGIAMIKSLGGTGGFVSPALVGREAAGRAGPSLWRGSIADRLDAVIRCLPSAAGMCLLLRMSAGAE